MMRNASGLSISAVVAPTSMLVNTTVQKNIGNDDASASLLAPAAMPEVPGICIASNVSASTGEALLLAKFFSVLTFISTRSPLWMQRDVLNLSQKWLRDNTDTQFGRLVHK
jgi:hypothetical protein